jgi:hypothetical protein
MSISVNLPIERAAGLCPVSNAYLPSPVFLTNEISSREIKTGGLWFLESFRDIMFPY